MRLERRGIEAVLCERRIRVAEPRRRVDRWGAGVGQERGGGRIGRDQAGLRTELGTHVGERHPLLHRQSRDRRPGELDGLVAAAVHAEAAEHVQHHVLGGHAARQLAVPPHADGLGHAQPDLAHHHHAQHLGAADTEHVGTESAAGRRVRIAADAQHARSDVAVLRHHHVAYAHAVVNVRQILFACPVARDAHDAARVVVTLGHVVVHHQHDARLVPDLCTQFFQHRLQPARARRVVEHRHVDLAGDDLADRHALATAGMRDELLG